MSTTVAGQQASPKVWEGAFSAIRFGFERIKQDPPFFVLYLAGSVLTNAISKANPQSSLSAMLSLAFTLAFLVAYTRYCLNLSAQKASPIEGTFRTTTQEYFRVLGAMLLGLGLVILSVFTLFIGLIWVLPWLIMVPYIILEEHVGVMEAFSRSRKLTNGHKGKVWGIAGAGFVLGMASAILNILPGIGWLVWLVAIVVLSTSAGIASAKLYHHLKVA